ncbi:hypothetical protein BAU16_01380 [Enterococcus sp. JM9B]|nr:hypothetical protein BAU16_01380 [Enterococcus sp. JM9B]
MQLAGIKTLDKRHAFFVKKLKTIERNMTVSLQLFVFIFQKKQNGLKRIIFNINVDKSMIVSFLCFEKVMYKIGIKCIFCANFLSFSYFSIQFLNWSICQKRHNIKGYSLRFLVS